MTSKKTHQLLPCPHYCERVDPDEAMTSVRPCRRQLKIVARQIQVPSLEVHHHSTTCHLLLDSSASALHILHDTDFPSCTNLFLKLIII
jgi:hypothetical protein